MKFSCFQYIFLCLLIAILQPTLLYGEQPSTLGKNGRSLNNGLVMLQHDWRGGYEELMNLKDDARLIRNVNPADHLYMKLNHLYFGALGQAPYILKSTPTSLINSIEKNGVALREVVDLQPGESVFHFNAEVRNNSNNLVNDALCYSTSLIPGRIEREYNRHAYAAFLKTDAEPEVFQIISQWGSISREKCSALAMIDREMRSVVLLHFPEKLPELLSLRVGRQDSHGGRDTGKRSYLEWRFPAFSLKTNETDKASYSLYLFRNIDGITGFADGLAVDGKLHTTAIAPGKDGELILTFAAALPLNKTIKVQYTIDGKTYEINKEIKLAAMESVCEKIPFSVKSVNGIVPVNVSFFDNGKKIGSKTLELNICKENSSSLFYAYKQISSERQKLFASLKYPGAETPQSLTANARLEVHLEKIADYLKFDELSAAAKELKKAELCLQQLREAVKKESKKLPTAQLRSINDLKNSERIYAIDNQLYTHEGVRLFMHGMCDTDQFLKMNNIFSWMIDPKGELDPKKSAIENLRNPRLRALAINFMINNIRRYGNAHSQYIDWANLATPEYRTFIKELLVELDKQGIYTAVGFHKNISKDPLRNTLIWSNPEDSKTCLLRMAEFMQEIQDLKYITYTDLLSPEPPIDQPRYNPNHWQLFRDWHAKKYGKDALQQMGFDNDSQLASIITNEYIFNPVTIHYSEFLSDLLGRAAEEQLQIFEQHDIKIPVYLGASVYTPFPVSMTPYINRFSFDKRVGGVITDTYLGGWWGAESNPPELSWACDHQYFRGKPKIIGEWGTGCAMHNDSGWKHAFESLRQAFGRYYFGCGVTGMFSWSASLAPWCNIFTPDGSALPVGQEFINMRDQIVCNSVTGKADVLSIAAIGGYPRYNAMCQIRLASSLLQLGVFADTMDYRDLDDLDLNAYRAIIIHTEGVPAETIAKLKNYSGKVILLGRPASVPDMPDGQGWIDNNLFLTGGKNRCSGGGISRNLEITFQGDLKKYLEKTSEKHSFAANRSAWFTAKDLAPDVKILGVARRNPVILQQGNMYWFTDMLGISNLDMPVARAVPYPALTNSELEIMSALLNLAGIPNSREEILVKVVNDSAVSYEVASGRVRFSNADAFKLSDGMFPRAYERFNDGIVLLTGGIANQDSFIELRCEVDKIKKVTLDGEPISYTKSGENRITIKLHEKEYALCDLRVYY